MSCDHVLHDRSLVSGNRVVDIHAEFAPSPRAAGMARALVASALSDGAGRMLADDVVHDAQLIVSELVTNAVRHARTQLQLGICHDESTLVLAVADGAPTDAAPAPGGSALVEDENRESGRGMLIVATLADDFGRRLRADPPGKVVWALLRTGNRPPT